MSKTPISGSSDFLDVKKMEVYANKHALGM